MQLSPWPFVEQKQVVLEERSQKNFLEIFFKQLTVVTNDTVITKTCFILIVLNMHILHFREM